MKIFPRLAAAALLTTILTLGATVSSASAHFLWLEPDEGGAKLYYGEFGENLREASPGLLDRLTPLPEAKAGAAAFKVEKTPGAFLLTGKAAVGDSIVAEQVRINERKQG